VTISGVTNFAINLGAGDDALTFGNQTAGAITILGNFSANLGNGNNVVLAAGGATSLTVAKNLSITSAAGNDNNTLIDVSTGGSLAINNGAGDSTTTISNDRGTGNFNSIGGGLSITNAAGADFNTIFDSNVAGNVTINNGAARITDRLAGFNRIFNVNNHTIRATIGGSMVVTNADGNLPGFGDAIADFLIKGNLTLNLGSGNVSSTIQSGNTLPPPAVLGNLLITGSGADSLNLGSTLAFSGSGPGLTVGGSLTITLTGTAPDTITTADLSVGKTTAITAGIGKVTITIDDSSSTSGSSFGGGFTLNTGAGADSVTLNASAATTTFQGAVSINLGAGNDTLNLGNNGVVAFLASALLDGGSQSGVRLPGFNTLQNGGNLSFITVPVFRNFP
jgi:hypothetical protein